MKKIIILFPKDSEALFDLTSSRTFGGASVQLFNIAQALSSFEDVHVVQGLYEYAHVYNNISHEAAEIDFVCAEKDSLWIKFKKTFKFLKRHHPDFVLQRGLTLFSCFLALFCRLSGIHFIFMFAHDLEAKGRYQKNAKKCPLYPLLLWSSWKLIAQHKWQYSKLPRNKRLLVYSGYPMPKRRSPKPLDPVLWVGRLEPWKNPEIFLDLARAFPRRNFVMIAPGFHRYHEYGKKIQDIAGKLANITLLDFVPYQKINKYFAQASYYVNTSDEEGFPNTFVQAAMNSVPIISFKVNPDNILSEYDLGICCNSSLDVLLSALKTNSADYKRYCENAYNYAYERHDINKIAEDIRVILQKC